MFYNFLKLHEMGCLDQQGIPFFYQSRQYLLKHSKIRNMNYFKFFILLPGGLRQMLTERACADQKLDIALSRGAPDNVTVVLLQM